MRLARKILRDHNGYDAVVRDRIDDPIRYLLNREDTPIPEKCVAQPNGFVVLDRGLQGQLQEVMSDSQ